MNNSPYKLIFDIYELSYVDKQKKDAIRQFIKRKLKSYSPLKDKKWVSVESSWDSLSKLERSIFIYIEIRQRMLDDYIDPSREKRLTKKIDNMVKKLMIQAQSDIESHNDLVDKSFFKFYNHTDTPEQKEQAYNDFSSCLKQIRPAIHIPTFDEWQKDNHKNPLRIYDYVMNYDEESNHSFNPYNHIENEPTSVSQEQINTVIIQTLLKLLSSEYKIDIDVSLIKDCLNVVNNYQFEEFEEVLGDYDSDLTISTKEQDEVINKNKEYFLCKNLLDSCAFWSKKN